MKSRLGIVLAIFALGATALACGSGGGADESSLSTNDFKQVCNSQGVEGTAYYGESEGGFSPIKVFRRSGPDEPYLVFAPQSGDFPSEWLSQDAELTELVLCLTVVEHELVAECYYTSEEGGEEIELTDQLYTATYEAVLYNAETAEEYAKTTFVSEASGECAEQTFDLMDMGVRKFDADPGGQLVPFLEPWVLP